jgi:hypothetical protein
MFGSAYEANDQYGVTLLTKQSSGLVRVNHVIAVTHLPDYEDC